jgi:formylglycine-generating enzyme required for sulfatase activity
MDSIAGNFRLVHAGSFTQGSPREEFGHAYNEEVQVPWQNSIVPFTVQHVLTRDILVMETEVTQEMWANLKRVQTSLPLDPTQVEGRGPKFPVNSVTWFESILFANLLTLKAGLKPCYYTNSAQSALINSSNYLGGQYYFDINANGYRLPTEAEWEYFCRAGTATPFHIYEPYYDGSNWQRCKSGLFQFLERVATICDNNKGGPVAVGTRDPNPWGLYDVHGNVAEWCWDWHLSYPSTQLLNYYGPNSGSQRIIRGGGWFWAASLCRSAARGSDDPGIRNNSFGFRLVRTLRQNY